MEIETLFVTSSIKQIENNHEPLEKKKLEKKYNKNKSRSTVEIKKYISQMVESCNKDSTQLVFNTHHLQEFYRFLQEKIDDLDSSFYKTKGSNLTFYEDFVEDSELDYEVFYKNLYFDSIYFSIFNLLNDLKILIKSEYDIQSYWEIIFKSLQFSFPDNQISFIKMKNDVLCYGRHLHPLIHKYFQ